jgi:hypothetical protein
MIEHKLPNKTKNTTVAEAKYFHRLNKPLPCPALPNQPCGYAAEKDREPAIGKKNYLFFILLP